MHVKKLKPKKIINNSNNLSKKILKECKMSRLRLNKKQKKHKKEMEVCGRT